MCCVHLHVLCTFNVMYMCSVHLHVLCTCNVMYMCCVHVHVLCTSNVMYMCCVHVHLYVITIFICVSFRSKVSNNDNDSIIPALNVPIY